MNDDEFKVFNDLKKSFENNDSLIEEDDALILKNGTCRKCKKYDVVIDKDSNKIVCEIVGL